MKIFTPPARLAQGVSILALFFIALLNPYDSAAFYAHVNGPSFYMPKF
jgi:hypothetical protein